MIRNLSLYLNYESSQLYQQYTFQLVMSSHISLITQQIRVMTTIQS